MNHEVFGYISYLTSSFWDLISGRSGAQAKLQISTGAKTIDPRSQLSSILYGAIHASRDAQSWNNEHLTFR